MNEELFSISAISLDPNFIGNALIQLALAFIMATILRWVYIRYGTALSNRRAFSTNFFLLAMTIAFIISIVKSSLALSLGLVGALSIVRFRTPIKEPEELAYLFLTIAIGIGLGANQILLTIIAFSVIVISIVARGHLGNQKEQIEAINLTILSTTLDNLDAIISAINPMCKELLVRRFEKSGDSIEIGLRVTLANDSTMQAITSTITEMDNNANIQFLNPQTIAV